MSLRTVGDNWPLFSQRILTDYCQFWFREPSNYRNIDEDINGIVDGSEEYGYEIYSVRQLHKTGMEEHIVIIQIVIGMSSL